MNIHNVSKATIKRRSDKGWTTMKVVTKCPHVEMTRESAEAIAEKLGLDPRQVMEVLHLINWDHGFVKQEVTLFHDEDKDLNLEIS